LPNRGATPPSQTAGRFLSSPEKAAVLQRVLDGAPNAGTGQGAVRYYLQSDFATSALNFHGTLKSQPRILVGSSQRGRMRDTKGQVVTI
jgi:hypothetical protein